MSVWKDTAFLPVYFLFFIFEFECVQTSFFSMFHLFAISSSQCAPKGSAEWPTHPFLVAWLAHNLLSVLPTLPPTILFQFEHTIAFQPVHLFYIYTFFPLNMSKHVSFLSFTHFPFLHPSVPPQSQQSHSPAHLELPGWRIICWFYYLPRHQPFCFSLSRQLPFNQFTFLYIYTLF